MSLGTNVQLKHMAEPGKDRTSEAVREITGMDHASVRRGRRVADGLRRPRLCCGLDNNMIEKERE
jgi:hypothetical protein